MLTSHNLCTMLKTQQLCNAQDSAASSGIRGHWSYYDRRQQNADTSGTANDCLTTFLAGSQLCKADDRHGKIMHA